MSATGCNPLPVRRAVLDAADVLASAEQWATKSRGGDSAPTRHGVGGAEVAKVAKAAAARAVPTTDGTISTFEVRGCALRLRPLSLPATRCSRGCSPT